MRGRSNPSSFFNPFFLFPLCFYSITNQAGLCFHVPACSCTFHSTIPPSWVFEGFVQQELAAGSPCDETARIIVKNQFACQG
jgi:hypothetical protein